MKRMSVFGLVAVVLLAAGAAVGYWIPRPPRLLPNQAAARLMDMGAPQMSLVTGAELKPLETGFDDWLYPNAESDGTTTNISGSLNGNPFEFQVKTTMHTANDFETVTKHYSEKLRAALRFEDDDPWSLPPEGAGAAAVNGVLVSYTMRPHRSRPVEVGVFGMQAKNCHLHFFITRGEGETETYINVFFSKWHVE
jgi:hypothetical protein